MTFAIETVYVVPDSNTLPTTGSTQNLTAGQFGFYLPDYSPATALNIGSAAYFYVDQGRNVYTQGNGNSPWLPGEGTRRSDRIYPKNIIEWYKSSGQTTASLQESMVSNFTLGCNEDITLTFRLHSNYIDTAYFNGLTASVLYTTPCCDCGENPCDTLSADDYQATVYALAAKISAHPLLSQYLITNVTGSGLTTNLIVSALPLDEFGNSCDLTAYPYWFDRIRFYIFPHNGPDVTTDYEVDDVCNPTATVTVLQRSSYPLQTPTEVQQVEKDKWSYQAMYKHIFVSPLYNGEYETYVDFTVAAYDMYYLKFKHEDQAGFTPIAQLDEAVEIYIPQGQTAAIEAILVAAVGPVTDTSGPAVTTTTTTSTSTSTTSTTTTLIP